MADSGLNLVSSSVAGGLGSLPDRLITTKRTPAATERFPPSSCRSILTTHMAQGAKGSNPAPSLLGFHIEMK